MSPTAVIMPALRPACHRRRPTRQDVDGDTGHGQRCRLRRVAIDYFNLLGDARPRAGPRWRSIRRARAALDRWRSRSPEAPVDVAGHLRRARCGARPRSIRRSTSMGLRCRAGFTMPRHHLQPPPTHHRVRRRARRRVDTSVATGDRDGRAPGSSSSSTPATPFSMTAGPDGATYIETWPRTGRRSSRRIGTTRVGSCRHRERATMIAPATQERYDVIVVGSGGGLFGAYARGGTRSAHAGDREDRVGRRHDRLLRRRALAPGQRGRGARRHRRRLRRPPAPTSTRSSATTRRRRCARPSCKPARG